MMYFNIIQCISLPHKLRFLIKMTGYTTSYNNWFRRYENFKHCQNLVSYSWNDVITSGDLKKCGCLIKSHKLYLIRNTFLLKATKKTSSLKICTTDVLVCSTILFVVGFDFSLLTVYFRYVLRLNQLTLHKVHIHVCINVAKKGSCNCQKLN